MKKKLYLFTLTKDLGIVLVGVALAVILVKTGILHELLIRSAGVGLLASFIAGIFLSSSLTIAVAAIAIVDVSYATSPILVALFGSIGAVFGDLFVFLFIRDSVGKDVTGYMKQDKYKKVIKFFHLSSIKWLAIIVGIISIALPIPDEFGLTLLSLSRVKTPYVLLLAFVTTFVEILTIISVSRML
jgi:hypothetical protein